MKTIDNLRQYFPVVTIALVLIAATSEASALNNQGVDGKGKGHERQWKENRKSDHHEYRHDNYEWRERRDGDRYYKSRDYHRDYYPRYSERRHHNEAYCYQHPRYGRVYSRFDRTPVVFRHRHGDYYYYGDNFYRYLDGVGYCVVEPPREVYFRYLPDDCNRVHVNGHVYFRHGDLYFQSSPRGYAIVPSPVGIQVSVGF